MAGCLGLRSGSADTGEPALGRVTAYLNRIPGARNLSGTARFDLLVWAPSPPSSEATAFNASYPFPVIDNPPAAVAKIHRSTGDPQQRRYR